MYIYIPITRGGGKGKGREEKGEGKREKGKRERGKRRPYKNENKIRAILFFFFDLIIF